MNGSSQLEEADQKPFALCPVCLRKMSSYLGFNGEELALFTDLRQVFKLMNHNDSQQNFRREIKLFDRTIARLTELYQSSGNLNAVAGWGEGTLQLQEGGNPELMNRLEKGAKIFKAAAVEPKMIAAVAKTGEDVASVSDITQKPVSDVTAGNQISIRQLHMQNGHPPPNGRGN
jgi:hypothetical protein